MNLIYKEYIKFLRDVIGKELADIKEGYFWLDKQIIKGFDKYGNIHKFYRVVISNDLSTAELRKLKDYDNVEDVDLASWQDLIEMKKEHLKQIESEAIILIKEKMKEYQEYTSIIPVSMGKDSMLTCYLVRSLYPDTKAVFNNTTLDCKDTYRMAKRFSNCEIMNPRKGFYEYVESHHMIPNRRSRFCCRIFKTGVMVSKLNHNHPYLLWMGMRNDESLTRKAYEDVWVNKAEMIEKRDKILSDINTLKCVAEEEFLSDVEQEYFKELDLNKAIKKNQSLREAKQKVLEAEKKRKEEELRRKEQEMKEQQETQAVEPFEFDFDPIPVPEPISRKVSSSSTPIQKNRKSSINNSSVQNYPYPLNREIHKPVMKTLNIKIRGEESVIRDIMKYIYDKKDIEILQ